MTKLYVLLVAACVCQRLGELLRSKLNQIIMKMRGFTRVEGLGALSVMVAIHVLWFVGLILEPYFLQSPVYFWLALPAALLFILAQLLRWWVLVSLGRQWNISVFTSNGSDEAESIVTHGPYRFLRHPNYVAVIIEIFSLPLVGGAYFTCILISVLNALVLKRRIEVEEKALFERPRYRELMGHKGGLIPRFLF